ncbi:MAG: hypothetical protein ACSHWN_00995 [Methylophilaceae bacterium]
MKSFIEKLFKREPPNYNYIVNEYKPSRGKAMSKPARLSEHDLESITDKDEMDIDNIYKKN